MTSEVLSNSGAVSSVKQFFNGCATGLKIINYDFKCYVTRDGKFVFLSDIPFTVDIVHSTLSLGKILGRGDKIVYLDKEETYQFFWGKDRGLILYGDGVTIRKTWFKSVIAEIKIKNPLYSDIYNMIYTALPSQVYDLLKHYIWCDDNLYSIVQNEDFYRDSATVEVSDDKEFSVICFGIKNDDGVVTIIKQVMFKTKAYSFLLNTHQTVRNNVCVYGDLDITVQKSPFEVEVLWRCGNGKKFRIPETGFGKTAL